MTFYFKCYSHHNSSVNLNWNNAQFYSSAKPLHSVPSFVLWFVSFCFLQFLRRTSVQKWTKNWLCYVHKWIVRKKCQQRYQSACVETSSLQSTTINQISNTITHWILSNCNGTWTHNHLVHKRTFSHLAKLAILDSLWKAYVRYSHWILPWILTSSSQLYHMSSWWKSWPAF